MKAVRILMYEHEIIQAFLTTLLKAAEAVSRGEGPDRLFFEKAVSFCRDYADKAHHYKEEHVMFGRLAQVHEGKIDVQIEKHRLQHEQCRDLVHEMSVAIESYERGEEAGAVALRNSIQDYVSTLRRHIRSEDEVFFPMVEVFLTEEDGEALLEEFEKYEKRSGAESFEQGYRIVEELEASLA
jgi:hemerythrin-like domain-containing protein